MTQGAGTARPKTGKQLKSDCQVTIHTPPVMPSTSIGAPGSLDLLDVGPGNVFGALTAVDEDQHAGIPLAEVAGALERTIEGLDRRTF